MPGTAKRKRAKKNRLSDLEPDEVSLVPVGANNRKFLITKSTDGEDAMDEILKQILEGNLENAEKLEEVLKAGKLSPEEMKSVKAAARLLNSVGGKVSEDVMQELRKLAGLKEYAKPKEKTRKELVEELRKEGFKIEEPKEPNGGNMDPEMKKHLDSIRKEYDSKFEDIKKENDTLRDTLKKERDLRMTREFEEKAESFGYKGDKAKEVASILKSASQDMNQENYDKIESLIKAQAAQGKVAHLFKETGSSQGKDGGTSDWEQELDAKKADIKKAHPDWSDAKVEDRALQDNPGLYNKYLDSNPAQGGR